MSIIQQINSIARLQGEFILRSGVVSDTYFDKYQFLAQPMLLKEIAIEMVKLIPPETQVLAGLEMGGIPLAIVLSQITGIPTAFIRKEPKTYGTCKYAEGIDLQGKKIVLIEDVVSSGGAIIDAMHKLQADGIVVTNALCVIDRETGGKENLLKHGIKLLSLCTTSELNNGNI